MPNLPISGLPISTDPRSDDLYPIAENSTGTRITKQISRANNNKKILEATAKTANYTLTTSDEIIIFNTTGGNLTANLPSAVGIKGKLFEIHKIGATNTLTIDPNASETIGGTSTHVLSENYSSIIIVSDGTNWLISAIGIKSLGNVSNPGTSIDNSLVRFDGTTGKIIQDSNAILNDLGTLDISNIIADYYRIDTAATQPAIIEGLIGWDSGNGTFEAGLAGGNVTLRLGEQTFSRVYNDSGVVLNKGKIVYLSGAQGNRIAVKLARANSELTAKDTLGMVAETIGIGSEGWVQTSGSIYNLNTFALTAGDTLFLSPTTAGEYTTTKPQAPDHLVIIGFLQRIHASTGSIYLKVNNGYELDELHDVAITNPQNGQVIIRDQATGVWKNANITQGSGIIITNGAGSVTIANSQIGLTDGDKTDITVSGSGSTWTIDNNAVTNAKINDVAWSKVTSTPTTLAGYGITDAQSALGFTPENVSNKENTTLDTSSTKYPTNNLVKTNIDLKVTANSAITGATKTKITYDSKGLVTAGADATTADIADSLDKRYITDAQKTVLTNTSGTNTGDQNIFSKISVTGQNDVIADTTSDTLTLAAGTNITITTDATTDTITINSTGGGGGGITDGDKGDITVSGSGSTWTIDNSAITLAKQADVATGTVFYRKTAGTGAPEVQTLSTLKTDLGLTGTNTGDQTITLTGNVTGSGTGSFATTIANDAVTTSKILNANVTYAKIQDVTNNRLLGRANAINGTVQEISLGSNLSFSGTTLNATTFQKIITSGTAAPSGGIDGDIYLQYT